MIISSICSNNFLKKTNEYTNIRRPDITAVPRQYGYDTVSFSGNSKSDDDLSKAIELLNQRLDSELSKLRNQPCSDKIDLKNNRYTQDRISQIEEITREYRLINSALSQATKYNSIDSAQIIIKYLDAMKGLGLDRGFNRISGYKDIKTMLKDKFILDSILKDKLSSDIKVPNVVLFYGPTNTGKSTFAKALCEQSLSAAKIIDVPSYINNDFMIDKKGIMNEIEETAKDAAQLYKQEGKRTIIILDEADGFINGSDEFSKKFMKFIKNCSDKYKCTVFITTNFPWDISEEILSPNITPIKVLVNPLSRTDCQEFIQNQLNMMNCPIPNTDIQKLLLRIFADGNKRYSAGVLKEMFKKALTISPSPQLKDYMGILDSSDRLIEPDITTQSLGKYSEFERGHRSI